MYWQITFTFHGYVSVIILYLLDVYIILMLFLDESDIYFNLG